MNNLSEQESEEEEYFMEKDEEKKKQNYLLGSFLFTNFNEQDVPVAALWLQIFKKNNVSQTIIQLKERRRRRRIYQYVYALLSQ